VCARETLLTSTMCVHNCVMFFLRASWGRSSAQNIICVNCDDYASGVEDGSDGMYDYKKKYNKNHNNDR
jgi:hypothetical protein